MSFSGRVTNFTQLIKTLLQQKIAAISFIILVIVTIIALLLPVLPLPDPRAFLFEQNMPPSLSHPMGTDNFGRELMTRVLWGTRLALMVAVGAAGISMILGILLGAIAGYFGGVADDLLSRTFDIFMVIPRFFLALLVVALFGSDVVLVMIVIGLTTWPQSARIMRSQVLAIKKRTFVEGVRSAGASDGFILFRHIVPNGLAPIITDGAILMGRAILTEAGLSFLGLGDPGAISWGQMIFAGKDHLAFAPWMSIFPGLAMLIIVSAMNLLSDGLNYVIDPRLRGRLQQEAIGYQEKKQIRKIEKSEIKTSTSNSVLSIQNLRMFYKLREGGIVRAVDDVSLDVPVGGCLGIVGESGCGKTSLGMTLMRVLPPNGRIFGGRILLDGIETLELKPVEFNKVKWEKIAMVFQTAMNSLNPVYRVRDQLEAAYLLHRPETPDDQLRNEVRDALEMVGLPTQYISSYPHELSGGMKQRVVIAMSILLRPKILIADEPTTALDVLVQDQILTQLEILQRELGLSLIIITHNMAVVGEMSDEVAVMYAGEIVEKGPTHKIFSQPMHPYTVELIKSIPDIVSKDQRLSSLEGEPADLTNVPSGCRFHPRCPIARENCSLQHPELILVENTHFTRCPYTT
jgi:peptide/nickel transport system permease protein